MRSKNVINNKNIIQICYEKVKRKKRKQPSQSQSQAQSEYNESSNVGKGLNIQPRFINNFPNSSRLEPPSVKRLFAPDKLPKFDASIVNVIKL